mmetsp:Transcript_118571/g.242315  ORF Transcript_118571/g.242315 Transcript_118571/m.242315 type:complete len:225 (+) Transcript_118571:85-759(+)
MTLTARSCSSRLCLEKLEPLMPAPPPPPPNEAVLDRRFLAAFFIRFSATKARLSPCPRINRVCWISSFSLSRAASSCFSCWFSFSSRALVSTVKTDKRIPIPLTSNDEMGLSPLLLLLLFSSSSSSLLSSVSKIAVANRNRSQFRDCARDVTTPSSSSLGLSSRQDTILSATTEFSRRSTMAPAIIRTFSSNFTQGTYAVRLLLLLLLLGASTFVAATISFARS